MKLAQRLQSALTGLDAAIANVDHVAAAALDQLPRDTLAPATPLQRIVHRAGQGGFYGGIGGAAVPLAVLLMAGTGQKSLREAKGSENVLADGLLGLPDRKVLAALAARPNDQDRAACALLGVAVANRALALLPRLACRVALAVGVLAGAFIGALACGLFQLAVEAYQMALAARQRRSSAGPDADIEMEALPRQATALAAAPAVASEPVAMVA